MEPLHAAEVGQKLLGNLPPLNSLGLNIRLLVVQKTPETQ